MMKFLRLAVVLLSGIGFLNAFYLALEHFSGGTPFCVVLNGCSTVLTSPYAVFWGMPLAYIGTVFYGVLFLGSLLFFIRSTRRFLFFLACMILGGIVVSLILFYVQAVRIGAFCSYCVFSEIIIVGLAIVLAPIVYEEFFRNGP